MMAWFILRRERGWLEEAGVLKEGRWAKAPLGIAEVFFVAVSGGGLCVFFERKE